MHLLGRSIRIELNPGTPGARTLLDVPTYNFDNQAVQTLATPVKVQRGRRPAGDLYPRRRPAPAAAAIARHPAPVRGVGRRYQRRNVPGPDDLVGRVGAGQAVGLVRASVAGSAPRRTEPAQDRQVLADHSGHPEPPRVLQGGLGVHRPDHDQVGGPAQLGDDVRVEQAPVDRQPGRRGAAAAGPAAGAAAAGWPPSTPGGRSGRWANASSIRHCLVQTVTGSPGAYRRSSAATSAATASPGPLRSSISPGCPPPAASSRSVSTGRTMSRRRSTSHHFSQYRCGPTALRCLTSRVSRYRWTSASTRCDARVQGGAQVGRGVAGPVGHGEQGSIVHERQCKSGWRPASHLAAYRETATM